MVSKELTPVPTQDRNIEKTSQGPREIPSIDLVHSNIEPDGYAGARFTRSIVFRGDDCDIRMGTNDNKESYYGDFYIELYKGRHREDWRLNQYSNALYLYFYSAKLPTSLVPDAAVSVNRRMSEPVAILRFKEEITSGRPLTDADLDIDESDVDSDYFDSVSSAIDILSDLADSIKNSQKSTE